MEAVITFSHIMKKVNRAVSYEITKGHCVCSITKLWSRFRIDWILLIKSAVKNPDQTGIDAYHSRDTIMASET